MQVDCYGSGRLLRFSAVLMLFGAREAGSSVTEMAALQ